MTEQPIPIDESSDLAAADLEDIRMLKNNRHFTRYFLRRVRENIRSREEKILDENTSPEETTLQKQIVKALKEDVLEFMEEDEVGCVNLLGG